MTAQEALNSSRLQGRLPSAIDLVLTAHIHVGEVLSFTGRRPPQLVVGISGTKLLPAVNDGLVGQVIDGETVTDAMMVSVHGFFGFEAQPQDTWLVDVLDVEGSSATRCTVQDKTARCRWRWTLSPASAAPTPQGLASTQ